MLFPRPPQAAELLEPLASQAAPHGGCAAVLPTPWTLLALGSSPDPSVCVRARLPLSRHLNAAQEVKAQDRAGVLGAVHELIDFGLVC
jgi:hypothetical protein